MSYTQERPLSPGGAIEESGAPGKGRIGLLIGSHSNPEGFPGGSNSQESAWNAGDPSSDPWVGKIPVEGHANSSILVWRILWIEEPGGLQSMGSQSQTQLSA